MFSSAMNKGVQFTFANGNTVSIQFGPGNYCEPVHPQGRYAPQDAPLKAEAWNATSAEIAAWNADGDWHNFGCDTVSGWQDVNEVLEFLVFAANNDLDTSKPFSTDYDDEDETLVESD